MELVENGGKRQAMALCVGVDARVVRGKVRRGICHWSRVGVGLKRVEGVRV